MSGFWEKVLSSPQPEQPSAPATTGDVPWWQSTVVNVPQPVEPAAPQPQRAAQPEPSAASPEESMSRTQWAKQSLGNCPSCGSTNYHAHPEAPQARPRCYDCGYPITQSGSGVTLKGQAAGQVKEARQTAASKTNDFNPRAIFDRLS